MSYYAKRFFGQQQLPAGAILHYPLSADAVDLSPQQNNGIVSGGVTFGGAADVNGVIKQCATFSNGAIVTNNLITPLTLTDKMTLSFWLKTSQTQLAVPFEYSPNWNHNNAFVITLNEGANGLFLVGSRTNAFNIRTVNNFIANDDVWRHYIYVIDRSLGATTELKVYVNNNLTNLSLWNNHNNNQIGNFSSQRFYIGARNANQLFFNGSISNVVMYDRVLTENEINSIFNLTQ